MDLEGGKEKKLCKINIKGAKILLYELLFWETGLAAVILLSGKLMCKALVMEMDAAGCYC